MLMIILEKHTNRSTSHFIYNPNFNLKFKGEGWRKQNVVVNFGKMLAFSLFKQKQMLALTQRLHFNLALALKWLGSTFVGGFSFILN